MTGIITFDCSADATEAVQADSICRAVGEELRKHYPHRSWYVDVTIKGGVVKILCPSISMRHGYVIHLTHSREELRRRAVAAGGEILERFKLSRESGAKGGEEQLERDGRGEVIQAATGL